MKPAQSWTEWRTITLRVSSVSLRNAGQTKNVWKTWKSMQVFPTILSKFLYFINRILSNNLEIVYRELIIGSKNILSFVVTVKNYGEPSYVTTLDINLPSRTNLKLTNLCKLFSFATSEEQLYSCQLSVNPLRKGSTVSHLIYYNI